MLRAAGAAGLTGLAGCVGGLVGGGDEDGVEYWTLFEGGDGDAMDTMVENANADHDLNINVQRVPFDEYYDRLSTSMTGDQVPDLAVMHADRIQEYKDYVVPVTDEIGTDPYVEATAQRGVVDGEQVAVPLDDHPYGLYYNKDLFEEAGLDPEDPPNTPEDFRNACEAIAENTEAWAGQFHSGGFQVTILQMFLASRGGQLLTDDLEPGFDSEDGVAVAEYVNSWVNEKEWFPQDSDVGWEAWQRGEAGMLFDGTWHLGVVRNLDFNWGLAKPFVMPDSDDPKSGSNSHMLIIPQSDSRDDQIEADAIEAMRLLTQDYNSTWGVDAGHLPANKEAQESDELRESETWDQTLSTYYEMAEADQFVYPPATENNGAYQEEIYQQLDDMRLGNIGPEEAIANAAEGVRQVFN